MVADPRRTGAPAAAGATGEHPADQDPPADPHQQPDSRSQQAASGQVMSGQVMSGQVMSGQAAADWDMSPVARWLAREGRLIKPFRDAIGALGMRLIETGAPIYRLNLSVPVLHPQMGGWSVRWSDGTAATDMTFPLSVRSSALYQRSPNKIIAETGQPVRCRILPDRVDGPAIGIVEDLRADGATDYIAMPLRFGTGANSGSISFASRRPDGFAEADLGCLALCADILAPVVEAYENRRLTESLLEIYLGGRPVRQILGGAIHRGDGEHITCVIWFADMRDSTPLSETMASDDMLAMLDTYFGAIAEAVYGGGGEVLRFIGDAMLAIFPVERGDNPQGACAAALDAGRTAIRRLREANHVRKQLGQPKIRFGIGLHYGEVMFGNIGAPSRLEFTVVGAAANRAARIEAETKARKVKLIASDAFAAMCPEPLVGLGQHRLRGVSGPTGLFTLPGLVQDRNGMLVP